MEVGIRAPMDQLWDHTQAPSVHERWDLRFSSIDYRPRASNDEPQRFTYETRLGLGLSVAGTGESVGQRDLPDGSRISSLTFASDSPLALIRRGSGYWKYIPAGATIRFVTWYDYDVRWGLAGRLIDRVCFRPLLGWATAWSFDRLRLWLEHGLTPEASARAALIHALARCSLATILVYHGLVPKLLWPHADEVAMLQDAGAGALAPRLVTLLGAAEILAGVVLVIAWRARWPLWASVAAMALATAGVAMTSPRFLAATFNPVTLNLAVASLALVALLALPDTPFAARCLRAAPTEL